MFLDRSVMLADERERCVKERLDCGGSSLQTYVRQGQKSTVSWKELPRGDLTIDDVPNPTLQVIGWMRIWRTTHTFSHPGLILTEKDKGLQVLVAVGQDMRMSG
jgi:hypothetical protein